MDRLGKVLYEESHQLVTFAFLYTMVVIEHQRDPLRELGQPVYECGKRRFDKLRPNGAQPYNTIAAESFPWRDLAQRLCDVPPQSDRIVILLVERDPDERQVTFFGSTPLG